MSKLQNHLPALPSDEVSQVKQMHEETGCTWQEAVRSVIERTRLNFLVNAQELY
jgi:hypothetical protein